MLKSLTTACSLTVILLACSGSDDGSSSSSSSGASGTSGGQTSVAQVKECSAAAPDCGGAGNVCFTLKENAQKKTGICVAECADDAGCKDGKCIDLTGVIAGGRKVCLSKCETDANCANGFACDPTKDGNFCFVRKADAPLPCGNDSHCTESKARCVPAGEGHYCTAALDVPDAFEKECTAETINGCAGKLCLTLKANTQKKTGICSADCTEDAQCPNGTCTAFGERKICLAKCTSDAECLNGFVCTGPGGAKQNCLVE